MVGTLAALLHHHLPLVASLKLLLDVARGLEYLHGLSVVHRGEWGSTWMRGWYRHYTGL